MNLEVCDFYGQPLSIEVVLKNNSIFITGNNGNVLVWRKDKIALRLFLFKIVVKPNYITTLSTTNIGVKAELTVNWNFLFLSVFLFINALSAKQCEIL